MIVEAIGPQGFGTYRFDRDTNGMTPSQEVPDFVLLPGFVDIHIHGAFDIDFMDANADAMLVLCDKLAALGYDYFLPTTITASPEAVLAAARSLPDHPMVPGFHLEGPFISPLHPGAQPPEFIADALHLNEWEEVLNHPKLKVVTLAPELPGAEDLIRRLVARGVTVSMGHSDATYAQAVAGYKAGAKNVTHTFNAMRGFHHREPGLAGFAMLEHGVRSEIIYDGVHASREAIELLGRSHGNFIAVSDSSRATGLPAGTELSMWGHECVVDKDSVRLASNGALAGSTITLADAFKNIESHFGAERAIMACCVRPLQVVGTSRFRSYVLYDPLDREIIETFPVRRG